MLNLNRNKPASTVRGQENRGNDMNTANSKPSMTSMYEILLLNKLINNMVN